MNNKNTWIALIVLIVVVLVAGLILSKVSPQTQVVPQTPVTTDSQTQDGSFIASASYRCDNSKTVQAAFYEGSSLSTTTVTNLPPTPTGIAIVVLDDGKTYRLEQTISADGGKYSNSDGSLVFWEKGNQVFVFENNKQVNYTNCKMVTE